MSARQQLTIPVKATDRASMESELNQAVAMAMEQAATERSRGILVTRHSYDSFIVELAETVPYGEIQEVQDW